MTKSFHRTIALELTTLQNHDLAGVIGGTESPKEPEPIKRHLEQEPKKEPWPPMGKVPR